MWTVMLLNIPWPFKDTQMRVTVPCGGDALAVLDIAEYMVLNSTDCSLV
jgi:hypothetical protein